QQGALVGAFDLGVGPVAAADAIQEVLHVAHATGALAFVDQFVGSVVHLVTVTGQVQRTLRTVETGAKAGAVAAVPVAALPVPDNHLIPRELERDDVGIGSFLVVLVVEAATSGRNLDGV